MADGRGLLEAVLDRTRQTSPCGSRVARACEAAYAFVITARGMLYDWGVFSATKFSVPVLSIGNLSVGGTGKTPVAAGLRSDLPREE